MAPQNDEHCKVSAESLQEADYGGRLQLRARDLVQDPRATANVLAQDGPFDAVVHCVGMLLPNQLNGLASGSGSVPAPGTTYEAIIKQTATNAADAAAQHRRGCAFVFISAAEAGWPEDAPLLPGFLRDYLAAKRGVEGHLRGLAAAGVPCVRRLHSCVPAPCALRVV